MTSQKCLTLPQILAVLGTIILSSIKVYGQPNVPIVECGDTQLASPGDATCAQTCGPAAVSAVCVPAGGCVCNYGSCTAADVVSPTLCPAVLDPQLAGIQADFTTYVDGCTAACPAQVCPGGLGITCNGGDPTLGTLSWICSCQCPPAAGCPVTTTTTIAPPILPLLLVKKKVQLLLSSKFILGKIAVLLLALKAAAVAMLIKAISAVPLAFVIYCVGSLF